MATNNSIVIDLTSDDEDISYLQPVADRNSFLPPVGMQPSQTLVFNGLPDPNEFSNRSNTQLRGRDAVARTDSKHGTLMASGQSPLAHPSAHFNKTSKRSLQPAIKPSVAYKNENTGVGSSGSRPTNAMEAGAKRRKLEDRTSGGRISTTPILPPSRPQTVFAGSLRSSGIQVVLPASPSQYSGSNGNSRTPGNRSRILPRARNTLPGYMTEPMSPEIKEVLDNQVLPHVHAAVRPYRDTLTHAERKEIGQNAASRLVTETGFMAHYLKNNKTITRAFEHQIKLKAYVFVNQGVENIVQKRLQEEEEDPSSSMQNDTTALAYNGLKSSVETSENESSPPSEELEHPLLEKKRRRALSVSTSTSYSNGHTDAETAKRTASVDEVHDSGSDVSRSRRAAAILPQGAYQVIKRPRRSAAEMEDHKRKAIRNEGQVDFESNSRNAGKVGSSPAPRPAMSARIEQIQAEKPKRRRRTKAQMEEARRLEGRGSAPAGTNPYFRFANESSSGSSLARGNTARPYMQLPVAQPVRNSGSVDSPLIDDPLRRPYISSVNRKKLKIYLSNPAVVERLSKQHLDMIKPDNLHVPFSTEEMTLLLKVMAQGRGRRKLPDGNVLAQIVEVVKDTPSQIPKILKGLQNSKHSQEKTELLHTRDIEAIADFLKDASTSVANVPFKLYVSSSARSKSDQLIALLRDREVHGMSPVRSRQGRSAFTAVTNSHQEDALIRQSEWTDCSGDISSITWTGATSFICGALAHSDPHNMQYNKPGNLLIGSTSLDRVESYPDHRVIRPVVANDGHKENANALESMRTTQSPWLYESVVSTAYSEVSKLSFTASFDKTVKVWSEAGSGLTLQGTWQHHEKVNFVTASPYHDRVATACAANGYAVRVYQTDMNAISQSHYQQYCGDRSSEGADEMGRHEKWSYQPATMQWGKSLGVRDFLLVGYSPRSIAGNDSDVPELKRNTGEICLWNTSTTEPVFVIAGKTHNVFEVIWHPTQPIFLAATSPHGSFDSSKTKTQVRIYHQQENGTFTNVKNLDCPAIDVNELTVKANSTVECFVTASCTDGFTYVWDSARGDQPIYALQHGETVDNPDPDVPIDVGDSGVKFAAWGMSSDRFYTGGSDGVIKAWNLKAASGNVFVRNVMTISGGISTGVFNADCSKLLIGDATGKIYFLSIDDSDIQEATKPACPANLRTRFEGSQLSRLIRRPKLVVPHPEPSPPPGYIVQAAELTGVEASQELLASGQIVRIPEYHNCAFQGPNYMQTNFFRREAHVHYDSSQPLIDKIWAYQRVNMNNTHVLPFHPKLPETIASSSATQHLQNVQQNNANFTKKTLFEWDKSKISPELLALLDDGKLLDLAQDVQYELPDEIAPRFKIFWERDNHLARRKGLLATIPHAGGGFVKEEEEEDDVPMD